jgi:hypothetical protein
VTLEPDRRPSLDRPSRARTVIGTIEVIATAAVVVAIVAFLVWFFASAHDPLLH